MPDGLTEFFSANFMPHGHCFLWLPGLVGLHVVSDAVIALSYYSIPLSLAYLTFRSRNLQFNWMFLMFAAFIFLCGTTHVMNIVTTWKAYYWLEGGVKALTAAVSLVTAVALWPLVPKILALPTHDDIQRKNVELAELAQSLEQRVQERTRQIDKQARELEITFEAAPSGMIMVDTSGNITMLNSTAEEIFGYSRGELRGKPVEMLLPERFRAGHPDLRAQYLLNPSRRRMGTGRDLYGLRKNGSEIPVEIGLNPARTEQGVFTLASVVDISERKNSERALAAKTLELERSNRDLEQFAYICSHDLQEPLRMVYSYMSLLKDEYGTKLDEDSRIYVQFAMEGSARMKNLINDLLQLSRVGTHGAPFRDVHCAGVVRQVIDDMSVVIHETGADVACGDLPVIFGDEHQIAQLFQNLIGNSIKYRSEEKPRIEIRCERTGDEHLFSVKDNGIGFDPKNAERIFQIFQRLHSREKYPGTGIGLAVCKKVVERHNGRIWAQSQPAAGTTIFFTLPA